MPDKPDKPITDLIAELRELQAKATPLPWPAHPDFLPLLELESNFVFAVAVVNAFPQMADEIEDLAKRHDVLVERSVLAMSYAEDEPELWEHAEPDCPMLEAVRQLRRRADSEYSLRTSAETQAAGYRKALEEAPHARGCASRHCLDDSFNPLQIVHHLLFWKCRYAPCNCFKAVLTETVQKETADGR